MKQPAPSEGNGRKIALAVALLLAAGIIAWFLTRPPDESALTSIAYPCLPLDATTTDPAKFIMVTGHLAPPAEHTMPDGTVVYAVFSIPDPKIVPLVDGKRLYFPALLIGEYDVETPPLPPYNMPLSKQYRCQLVRYMTPETMQQLKAAVAGSASPPAAPGDSP